MSSPATAFLYMLYTILNMWHLLVRLIRGDDTAAYRDEIQHDVLRLEIFMDFR